MKTWIKALLPLTVLVLSLLLIFIAIAPGARTTLPRQHQQGEVGCLGDKICEQDAELSRRR
jgi:hypothetical protein